MDTVLVRSEKANGVATITLDNPPLNVMSQELIRQLGICVEEIAADPDVVAIVVTGSGNRAFMAGADIKEFPGWMEPGMLEERLVAGRKVMDALDGLPKPTIAAIEGYCFGAGCEVALLCDLRVAGETAQFGLPEIKLGLFPGGGGTQRLGRLVGEAKAKELMFIGDPISAQEAHRIGLINTVVTEGQALEHATAMAWKIASRAGVSLRLIKEAVDYGLDHALQDGLDKEAKFFAKVFDTEDVREGVQAFIEKRTPLFKHR